jgi:50S ribosomal protein L16 3-hydroxylase
MDVNQPLQLLGGLSASLFMRRYWQKKPLLIRQALSGFASSLEPAALFALAGREEVESRLVIGQNSGAVDWKVRQGPFVRRALPPLKRPGWTLLVQGVDLHVEEGHDLLNRFRFVPDARLDDLMVSYASDGGGVGPHFDSYDVFLLQARGRRRWRIGRQKDLELVLGAPLKILRKFEPEQEFDLEPGDMLYLPPRYAHDGVALGECMTYSIGFKAPARGDLAGELLERLAHDAEDELGDSLYRDAGQGAVDAPGAIPAGLSDFARAALQRALQDPAMLDRALGEYLSQPKPRVWFDGAHSDNLDGALRLDRRTRMMYDKKHVFINGDSYRASGRDATLMRRLADVRQLDAVDAGRVSAQARAMLSDWCEAGWIHAA